jgi:hypothetical protein
LEVTAALLLKEQQNSFMSTQTQQKSMDDVPVVQSMAEGFLCKMSAHNIKVTLFTLQSFRISTTVL